MMISETRKYERVHCLDCENWHLCDRLGRLTQIEGFSYYFILNALTSHFLQNSHFFHFSIVQIFFSFMLTPLFKKPKFASTVGSMLTVVFGCLSLFTVLMRDFPQSAVWLLCLLSPSAFSIGIAQVTHKHTHTLYALIAVSKVI